MKSESAFLTCTMALVFLFCRPLLHAEISIDVWKALINQNVAIEKNDGSEVAGSLSKVTDKAIVVIKENGRVVSVSLAEVQNLQVIVAPDTSAEEVSINAWGALVNLIVTIEKNDGSEVTGRLASAADKVAVIVRKSGQTVSVPTEDVQSILVSATASRKTAQQDSGAANMLGPSAGAGASMEFMFHPGLKRTDSSGNTIDIAYGSFPVDIKAFLDMTYLQISVGYMSVSGGNTTTKVNGSISGGSFGESYSWLTSAAYLKYPVVLGAVSLFPLVGFQYRLNLAFTDSSGNDLRSGLTNQQRADLNEVWLGGGLVADFSIGSFFIRPEALVGFKLHSTTDDNIVSAYRALGSTDISLTYLTFGINVLVGFRL
jgi:small nuclear ribonucleoprotein (snRNP)-like protein